MYLGFLRALLSECGALLSNILQGSLHIHTGRKKCVSSTVYVGFLRAFLSECGALLSNVLQGSFAHTYREKEVRFLDSVSYIVKEKIRTSFLSDCGALLSCFSEWLCCTYIPGERSAFLRQCMAYCEGEDIYVSFK